MSSTTLSCNNGCYENKYIYAMIILHLEKICLKHFKKLCKMHLIFATGFVYTKFMRCTIGVKGRVQLWDAL